MIEKTCPVCGRKTDNATVYCPDCGWEYRTFPAVMTEAVRKNEEQRLQAAQQAFADNKSQVKALEKELLQVKQALDDANSSLQQAKRDLQEAENTQKGVNYAYLVQSYNGVLQNVYPVAEGDTIFGSAYSENKNHRQILEGTLAAQHFVIRTTLQVNPRGRKKASYEVIPCSGQTHIASPGNVVTKVTPLPLLEKLYAGGLVFQLLDDVDT